jgi:hypothetical protein
MFAGLHKRIDDNAKRAVDVYTTELPDYRAVAANTAVQAAMLDFAVMLRRREAELGAIGQPFTDTDLGVLRAYGEERGLAGVSLLSQQRVLVLHSVLTLREIQEAAGPDDSADLMHMLGWLPENGLSAQTAYTDGYLDGQKRFLPVSRRIQNFARMLLADNLAVRAVAASLEMPLAERYVVTVVRVPSEPFSSAADRRDEVVEVMLRQHRVPVTWHASDEFVVLFPLGSTETDDEDEKVQDRAFSLVRDFAHFVGRPCAAGASIGRIHHLADALKLARRISRAAPVEAVPRRLHGLADVFVELGVGQVPEVDAWLNGLARRLAAGPDLVTTLDAFYQYGMNRMHTAGALHIHPRTLDYRLRRVRDLVGIDPASVRGARALSTTVTLVLAGTWT